MGMARAASATAAASTNVVAVIGRSAAMPARQKSAEGEEPRDKAGEDRPLAGEREDREQHRGHEDAVPQPQARGEAAVLGRLEIRALPHGQRWERTCPE